MKIFNKWFFSGFFAFVAVFVIISIFAFSVNPFEVNILGHVIDKDYLEAGMLLSLVLSGTLWARKSDENNSKK